MTQPRGAAKIAIAILFHLTLSGCSTTEEKRPLALTSDRKKEVVLQIRQPAGFQEALFYPYYRESPMIKVNNKWIEKQTLEASDLTFLEKGTRKSLEAWGADYKEKASEGDFTKVTLLPIRLFLIPDYLGLAEFMVIIQDPQTRKECTKRFGAYVTGDYSDSLIRKILWKGAAERTGQALSECSGMQIPPTPEYAFTPSLWEFGSGFWDLFGGEPTRYVVKYSETEKDTVARLPEKIRYTECVRIVANPSGARCGHYGTFTTPPIDWKTRYRELRSEDLLREIR